MTTFNLKFKNSFAALPDYFYTKMLPEKVALNPKVVHINTKAAQLIDLNQELFTHPDFPFYFSGNKILPGAEPLAQVYSGHQFGQWAGQLGDGRALLLGQVCNNNGELWDIQLKGAGLTPYSRFGDGRAVMRSCIREYLGSEALFGLGIPTTRALCIIATGQPVARETIEPGAVLTRLAPSHVRFGHFEHFQTANNLEAIKQLADYIITEHFTELKNMSNCYSLWFSEIVKRTAMMIAQWQAVGFCHGVMNTDNMSVLGLTLDYGPFGFMEAFQPNYICNHSDYAGRYAYHQQPTVGLWNLHVFAHALQSLVPREETEAILKNYEKIFIEHYKSLMRQKLALEPTVANDNLWITLLTLMASQQVDYTLSFRYLAGSFENSQPWLSLFSDTANASHWLSNYHQHIINSGKSTEVFKQQLQAVNPKFVLRNWVAETAIRSAEDLNDYSPIETILKLIHSPYDEHSQWNKYAQPAPESMRNLYVSCSS